MDGTEGRMVDVVEVLLVLGLLSQQETSSPAVSFPTSLAICSSAITK